MPLTPQRETTAFGHLSIDFDERILRPREWTAEQSAWAAELLRDAPAGPVLELCAGAGHIGLLAIATEPRPLVCVDLSPVAAGYARHNAEVAGLGPLVEVREGPMERMLRPEERFVLVIADPPWVRREETGRYPEDPLLAIDGGDDGLDVARLCLSVAAQHLVEGGSVILQLGRVDQVEALREHLAREGQWVVAEVRSFERGSLIRLLRESA